MQLTILSARNERELLALVVLHWKYPQAMRRLKVELELVGNTVDTSSLCQLLDNLKEVCAQAAVAAVVLGLDCAAS